MSSSSSSSTSNEEILESIQLNRSIKNEDYELVVMLEGNIETTGAACHIRTSYLPQEILFGYRFTPIYPKFTNSEYLFDYSKFDHVEPFQYNLMHLNTAHLNRHLNYVYDTKHEDKNYQLTYQNTLQHDTLNLKAKIVNNSNRKQPFVALSSILSAFKANNGANTNENGPTRANFDETRANVCFKSLNTSKTEANNESRMFYIDQDSENLETDSCSPYQTLSGKINANTVSTMLNDSKASLNSERAESPRTPLPHFKLTNELNDNCDGREARENLKTGRFTVCRVGVANQAANELQLNESKVFKRKSINFNQLQKQVLYQAHMRSIGSNRNLPSGIAKRVHHRTSSLPPINSFNHLEKETNLDKIPQKGSLNANKNSGSFDINDEGYLSGNKHNSKIDL